MYVNPKVTVLLGIAGLALATTVVVAGSQATAKPQASSTAARGAGPSSPAATQSKGGPMRTPVSVPPLPNVGFAPVRPMAVVRATYD